jgi:outer membrane immunogenic protein
MKKLLVATTTAVVLTATAMAAEMPVKAPPAVAAGAAYNWSGCYIGGNVGAIRSADRLKAYPSPVNFAAFPQIIEGFATYHDLDQTAVTYGGQVGCNAQSGSFVLGVELDVNGSGLNISETQSFPLINLGVVRQAHTEPVTERLSAFATFRGRFGYAQGPWLAYVTGGLAGARATSTWSEVQLGTTLIRVGSESGNRYGWTLGGGVEYAWSANWSTKVEYLYLDLGTVTYAAPFIGFAGVSDFLVNIRARDHVVRVGLNYKFDWGNTVRAAY